LLLLDKYFKKELCWREVWTFRRLLGRVFLSSFFN